MRSVRSLTAIAQAALLVATCSWAATEEPPGATRATPEPLLFTPLDYFEQGQRAVADFLRDRQDADPAFDLAGLIERLEPSCVRVEVRFDGDGETQRSVIGSGILVDDGRRIYTAGHSFVGIEDPEITVTLPSGVSRSARLQARARPARDSTSDWALLELVGQPLPRVAEVELGSARRGDTVLVLGYPDQIGIDARGRVAYASSAAGEAYRGPLATLATVASVEPLTLAPLVGAVPTGGMSGGPVLDTRGRLVGLFVSVGRVDADGAVSYTFAASPTASLPAGPPIR